MINTDLHNVVYALVLHRYVLACRQDKRGTVTVDTAITLWQIACKNGLEPSPSLPFHGFETDKGVIQPLSQHAQQWLESRMTAHHGTLAIVASLEQQIADIQPRRLLSVLVTTATHQ